MKYLKKLNEYADSVKDPEVQALATELDGGTEETSPEFDPNNPTETSEQEGIHGATWEAEMSGAGDYKLTFKNSEGKETTCIFKDTGNRRGGGETLNAAFVGMEGTSSDGKNYVAEAIMKRTGDLNYSIESFIVFEHL